MKRRIFWSVFFIVFLKVLIYETIASIFWQSASYVFMFGCDCFILSPTASRSMTKDSAAWEPTRLTFDVFVLRFICFFKFDCRQPPRSQIKISAIFWRFICDFLVDRFFVLSISPIFFKNWTDCCSRTKFKAKIVNVYAFLPFLCKILTWPFLYFNHQGHGFEPL